VAAHVDPWRVCRPGVLDFHFFYEELDQDMHQSEEKIGSGSERKVGSGCKKMFFSYLFLITCPQVHHLKSK
jgi:hypothetical protein